MSTDIKQLKTEELSDGSRIRRYKISRRDDGRLNIIEISDEYVSVEMYSGVNLPSFITVINDNFGLGVADTTAMFEDSGTVTGDFVSIMKREDFPAKCNFIQFIFSDTYEIAWSNDEPKPSTMVRVSIDEMDVLSRFILSTLRSSGMSFQDAKKLLRDIIRIIDDSGNNIDKNDKKENERTSLQYQT